MLNKSDLAEEQENRKWVEYYKTKGIPAVLVDCNQGKGIDESIKKVKEIMQDDIKKAIDKGKIGSTIRVLVLGIPNVGKSSYINRATRKVSAKVGNKPGVTRQKQWIRLDNTIQLLDTPGVLWPKFDNQEIALNLAYTGTIKEDILEKTELAYSLLEFLDKSYSKNLKERYNLEENQDSLIEKMEQIGKRRGAIISGGRVDLEKTAGIILDDFRNGKLGKITLEKVEEK